MKDDLNCSVEAAQELLDFLKSRTPLKEKYFEKCRAFTEVNGFIISDNTLNCVTHFDQHAEYRRLKNLRFRSKLEQSSFYKIKGNMERFSQNNRIQNTGAIMSKTAHILINDEFIKKGWTAKAKVVNMIHDECLVECDEDIAEEVAQVMSDMMVKAGTYYCKTIPMVAEPAISDHWDH